MITTSVLPRTLCKSASFCVCTSDFVCSVPISRYNFHPVASVCDPFASPRLYTDTLVLPDCLSLSFSSVLWPLHANVLPDLVPLLIYQECQLNDNDTAFRLQSPVAWDVIQNSQKFHTSKRLRSTSLFNCWQAPPRALHVIQENTVTLQVCERMFTVPESACKFSLCLVGPLCLCPFCTSCPHTSVPWSCQTVFLSATAALATPCQCPY